MPEVKISELPAALALTGAEALPVVQSGSTRRTTTGAFATAAQGALAGTALQPGAQIPWSDVTGKPTFAAVATSGAYADLTGAPGTFAGSTPGLVPTPGAGAADRFLRADGTFVEPPGAGGGGTVGWTDVTDKPAWTATFDGSYSSLTGAAAISDVTGLQTALDNLAIEDGDLGASLSGLNGTVTAQWAVTAIFDASLAVGDSRPAVDTTQRVMWPVARAPVVAVAGGVLTPTLGGAPVNAGPNDTFDPEPDIFAHTLIGNVQIANLLAAGGGALGVGDAGRTGYFHLTQDGTGGRSVTIDGGSHYKLVGAALGGGGALPIQTGAGAVNVIYFHIISPTLVHLAIADPVT